MPSRMRSASRSRAVSMIAAAASRACRSSVSIVTPACCATFAASSSSTSPRSVSASSTASSARFQRTSITWIAVTCALFAFASVAATLMTSASTAVPPRGTTMRRSCMSGAVYVSRSPLDSASVFLFLLTTRMTGVVRVVRDIDDDRVRAEEEGELEAQRGLAVEDPLPPVPRHELGEDDGDGLVIALVDALDVAQQRLQERAVGRFDDIHLHVARPPIPALLERARALRRRRDVHRLHRRRDRSRERDGLTRRPVEARHRHDDDRWLHHRKWLVERGEREGVGDARVVAIDPVEHPDEDRHDDEDHPRTVPELRVRDDDEDRAGDDRAKAVDEHGAP